MAGTSVDLLHPCFWPEVLRGSERMIRELANGLIEAGEKPRLITSHPARPSRAVEDGLPIVRNWRPPEGWVRRRGFDDYLTHVPFTYASLRSGDADVVHSFFPTDSYAAARWSQKTGKPSVFSFMGVLNPQGKRPRYDALPRAMRNSTEVVVLSQAVARSVMAELGVEARVIYPSVDTSAFTLAAGGRSERPTIFCAGAPDVARKRVPMLVEAFAQLRERRPDARLMLLRPHSDALARELDQDGVELIPWDTDVAHLAGRYREAWVSCLPSLGEAFGIVLIESLACGTPVVGSNVDAFPEIVDSDAIGRLFDPHDVDDLARALDEALDLSQQPGTAEACRARAERFSTERMVEEHERLYADLVR